MNIMWYYLDTRAATIKAVKDYQSMKYIIDSTEETIKNTREDMVSVGSPVITDMPKGPHNPQANENRIINALDKINIAKERYAHAIEYMAWFNPAWQQLSDDEKFVIETYYWNDGMKQTYAIESICERLCIERSSAYNKKNRALERLALILYGA